MKIGIVGLCFVGGREGMVELGDWEDWEIGKIEDLLECDFIFVYLISSSSSSFVSQIGIVFYHQTPAQTNPLVPATYAPQDAAAAAAAAAAAQALWNCTRYTYYIPTHLLMVHLSEYSCDAIHSC